MKRKFNDDFYSVSVDEWENEKVPERAVSDYKTYGVALLPVIIAIGSSLHANFLGWCAVVSVAGCFLRLFVFMEELNENIRFVRHQNRTLREAVRRMVDESLAMTMKHNIPNPLNRASVGELLNQLDNSWEYPYPENR